MRRVDQLLLRQRVVLVIAFGVVLLVLGGWITDRGRLGSGWFGYAPNASIVVRGGGAMGPGAAVVVRLCLIVLWAAVSLWLLRSSREDRSRERRSRKLGPSNE
jgi:hypothetical protein